jgi:hypothetical protein
MRHLGLMLLALFSLSSAIAGEKTSSSRALPSDVQKWLDRYDRCARSSGWSPKMDKFRCSDLELEERKLREKYGANRKAIATIDQAINKHKDVE